MSKTIELPKYHGPFYTIVEGEVICTYKCVGKIEYFLHRIQPEEALSTTESMGTMFQYELIGERQL